jgi:hypothetical protein
MTLLLKSVGFSGATLRAISVAAIASAVFGVSAARAGCDDRPGTPDNVSATATSSSSITFSWRNTVFKGLNPHGVHAQGDMPHNIWADIYIRTDQNGSIGKDVTGGGPYSVVYGDISKYNFTGLGANSKYCIAIRARTAGGGGGCVSAVTSSWACAVTLPPGAAAVRQPPAPVVGTPNINVSGAGTFHINGSGFLPNHPVAIREAAPTGNNSFSNQEILTIGGRVITSDSRGNINVTLSGICGTVSYLFLSVSDGRPGVTSNSVRSQCS